MAIQIGLDLSTTSHDTTSASTSGIVRRILPTNNLNLVQSILGTTTPQTSNGAFVENRESEIEFNRPANQLTCARNRSVTFSGLGRSGWTNELSTWSDADLKLLENSWRPSTLKTYKPIWQRWCKWAVLNDVRADNPSPQCLAKYLCFLFNQQKLAPRTTALPKSVVATFANPNHAEALSSHRIVKQVLKGIYARNPPQRKPIPWKIDDLINFLKTVSFDENSIFGVSRHTCILLLLASGRRVHDLTLLTIEDSGFGDSGEQIILWPRFGSKSDCSTYRESGWLLKSVANQENPLDLVRWVRNLISATSSRRNKINNLFIITKGEVKAASRSIIAGWIRTLFKEAGIDASAGSFKAVVSSDIWSSNKVNIDEVLKRGNWQCKNTFLNHHITLVRFQVVQEQSTTN